MAEDAKKSAADAAEQKGRAEHEEKTPKPEEISEGEIVKETDSAEKNNAESENVNSESSDETQESTTKATDSESEPKAEAEAKDEPESKSKPTKKSDDNVEKIEIEIEATGKSSRQEDFQSEIREQIENCKFEIIAALQEHIHEELQKSADWQIRRVERRRRAGFIIRDIIILLLAIAVGYFGYCLYDAEYFDFFKPSCDSSNCQDQNPDNLAQEPEVIKDTTWYLQNYDYLFKNLQINLDADKINAYYLYSDDRKVSEIQPEYLLAMAYNHLETTPTIHDGNITISTDSLRTAFTKLYGNADHFAKQNFTYSCHEFQYDRASDSFIAANPNCQIDSKRQILEQIDEVYEEGNVMYFITTATIYDKSEQSFYTFDDLFKPIAANVEQGDLTKYSSLLNHYQYRFKQLDGQYYFSDITKLR